MRAIVFLQPGMADWEAGPVTAVLREYFDVEIVTATPSGGTVTSIGGLNVTPDRSFDAFDPAAFDIVLAIGSDEWPGFEDATFSGRMKQAVEQGKVVGVICAATVMAARAGLFEGRRHTSNGRDWLSGHAPGYAGEPLYQDVPHAVVDGNLVSAPGSAPHTFAAAIARLAAPDRASAVAGYEAMAAAEWSLRS
jgi:putative intracellular protease/amidase